MNSALLMPWTFVFGALAQGMRQQVATALVQPTKDGDKPVSLREYCAHIAPEDMHQTEGAARHISIFQSRMFSTVTASQFAVHGNRAQNNQTDGTKAKG